MGLGSAQKIVADHPLYLNMLPEEDFKKAMDAIMNCLILAFMDGWIARGQQK